MIRGDDIPAPCEAGGKVKLGESEKREHGRKAKRPRHGTDGKEKGRRGKGEEGLKIGSYFGEPMGFYEIGREEEGREGGESAGSPTTLEEFLSRMNARSAPERERALESLFGHFGRSPPAGRFFCWSSHSRLLCWDSPGYAEALSRAERSLGDSATDDQRATAALKSFCRYRLMREAGQALAATGAWRNHRFAAGVGEPDVAVCHGSGRWAVALVHGVLRKGEPEVRASQLRERISPSGLPALVIPRGPRPDRNPDAREVPLMS